MSAATTDAPPLSRTARRRVEERILSWVRVVVGAAGTVLIALWPVPEVWPEAGRSLAYGAEAAIVLVGCIGLAGTRKGVEAGRLARLQLFTMIGDVLTLSLLALLYGGAVLSPAIVLLLALPVIGALKYGPRGAVLIGAIVALEAPLRYAIVRSADRTLTATELFTLTPGVLVITTIAAALAWASQYERRRAAAAFATSDRQRREAEVLQRLAADALVAVGDGMRDLATDMASELDLPLLVVLRRTGDGIAVLSATDLPVDTEVVGVPVDPGGPLETALRTGRTVVRRRDLENVTTGLPAAEAEVVIPVTDDGEVVGALICESEDPQDFPREVVGMLERISVQVSLLFRALQQMEAKEQLAEHYRELDRDREAILSIASHELRTPLTSIVGFSELLTRSDVEIDPDHRAQYAGSINRNAQRLIAWLEDLQLMQEVHRGDVSSQIEATCLGRRVTALAEAEGWGASVQLVGPDGVEALVDGEQFDEIIRKLVDNARTHGEGPVLVRWALAGSGVPVVRVEDHGPGIPPEREEELLRPFSQGIDVMAHSRGGGLGLAIASGLAGVNGGSLSIDRSMPGVFSMVVTLMLPTAVEERSGAVDDRVDSPVHPAGYPSRPADDLLVRHGS